MEKVLTRQARKERTREAILDAALELATATSLSSLSLRAVAKEVGIVPTAFYRHFASIDELGLALVDRSFASLRDMLRDVRRGEPEVEGIIANSVRILVKHVRERRDDFQFIARERLSGPTVVRDAIWHEMELFKRELALDVSRLQGQEAWSADDLHALADLIVTTMVGVVEAIVSTPSEREHALADIANRAEKQLRIVVIGAANWRSRAISP